jgi:hypothetical protein
MTTRRGTLGIAALSLALAGLTLAGVPAGGAQEPASAAAQAQGRLTFNVRFVGPYVQGSVPFILVREAGGDEVVRREVKGGATTVPLPAGQYTVASYWRPCQGRCDPEDLATDRCGRHFTMHTARRGDSETIAASAVFSNGEPCTIKLDSDYPPLPSARTGGATLDVKRGVMCRPQRDGCTLPARAPRTKGALPVKTGSRVTVSLGAPARRILLKGICGGGTFIPSAGGRNWTFRVPADTLAHFGDCRNLGLEVTYKGPGIRKGVRAAFGFRLRAAG